MISRTLQQALGALLIGAAALPAWAASSAASTASDSVSTSVGSLSNSVGKSSDSSTKGKDVAQGEYRVIDIAALAAGTDQPALQRVKLQAVADASADGELLLMLPPGAVLRGQLAPGVVVIAKRQPYGLAFSAAATQQVFFLALTDDWYRELDSRPVVL